jgi:AAA+ ATPase superfamily predicted ATPase
MDNPYVHRTAVSPDMFFGRAKELNTIVQRISGKKPLCISIVGSRRIRTSSNV